MAPPRQSEMLQQRGLPGLSVEPVIARTSTSIAGNQQAGTPLGVPTDTMGSSLVPSSGVELQTGWSAASLVVQQPMEIQHSGPDLGAPSLAGFDPTQPQGSTYVDAANLAHEFGNESESNGASHFYHAFQPYQQRAGALSTGTGSPMSHPVDAAPTATGGLPGSLGQGPEISPLPEIEPLTAAEEYEMLQLLFENEHRQNMQDIDYQSPHLHQPNHLGEQIQAVNYDPPGDWALPQHVMTPSSASHPQSLPYEHHQQNPQQPLIDLDGGLPQLMRCGPLRAFPSSEPCAMYPPQTNPSIIAPIVPAIVQNVFPAAPTMNITPFDMLAQPPAMSPSAHVPDRSTNHLELAAQIVSKGKEHCGGLGNRPTERVVATEGKRSKAGPVRTKDGTVAPPRKNRAEALRSLIVTQRKNHILAERQRRSRINSHYATIRSLLPAAKTKKPSDHATTVLNMVNFIKLCQNNLTALEPQLEQQHQSAARNRMPSNHGSSAEESPVPMTRALTCVDRTHDPSALTAVTTAPAAGSDSCLASFLGTNVALHVCGHTCFLTISSPYRNRSVSLLTRIVLTVLTYDVMILQITLVSRGNTTVYSLQCQVNTEVEFRGHGMHTMLQSVVNCYISPPPGHVGSA